MHFLQGLKCGLTLAALSTVVPVFATEFFVSPIGSAAGNGSRALPWNLSTALAQPAAVRPGDTIWLLGGQYDGFFNGNLNGAPGAPIVVRQYPGERAILQNAGAVGASSILEVHGSWTWYWGFEIQGTLATKYGERSTGLNVFGPNVKLINLVIHDTGGIGFWNGSDNSEMYGNVIFYNGYQGSDRGHGHAIYSQNKLGTKRVVDNVYLNSFGHGLHIYGSANAFLSNYWVEGNIGFNNGTVSLDSATTNILVGGGVVADNHTYLNNYTYFNPGYGGGRAGHFAYGLGCSNSAIRGNMLVGSPVAAIVNCTNLTMNGNTMIGTTQEFTPSSFANNTYLAARPTGSAPQVFVRPNQYEPGRAHVAIYNWAGQASVPVNVSGVLAVGDTFEVRDSQDFFGTPMAAGVYSGSPVNFSMLNTNVWQGIGAPVVALRHTPPEFGAFIVIKKSASSTIPIPDRAPVVTAGANQTITLPATATLSGLVTDPGSPTGPVTVSWLKTSGPGTVTFGNATAAQTTASFSAAGAYFLQFTASNGRLASSATVAITVNAAASVDRAPAASAGANQTITLPATATLAGQVTDPGSPSSPVTTAWTRVSGAGTVTFTNAAAAQTSAAFSTAGTYVLQLTASNPKLSGSAQVTITVNAAGGPPPPPPPPPPGGPVRINVGGNAYRDAAGNSWLADQYFTGGTTFATTGSIGYSSDPVLYDDQRLGDFTYRVPAANGLYSVVLGYAELLETAANKRLFNVYINGTLVAGNYDIVARASAAKVMLNQGITVDNRVGYIEVKYVSVVGQAVLNALQVIPVVLY